MWYVCITRIPVKLRDVRVDSLFHVAVSTDPYTAILGRTWLDEMGQHLVVTAFISGFLPPSGKYVQVKADAVSTI